MSNAIESVPVETRVFPPPERASQGASIPSMDAYKELCARSRTTLTDSGPARPAPT